MAADRHIQIGHDAQGNVLVTGDDNRVYVFPGITELTPELLAQLQSGVHTLQDAPGAVPLPLLTLRISAHDTASNTWTVTSVYPEGEHEPRLVSTPWATHQRFTAALQGFWELSRRTIENEAESHTLHAHALVLGEALSAILASEDRKHLEAHAHDDGPPPLLVIESHDDVILALPWELLRLEERYAVRDGRLDVARSVSVAQAPHLLSPTTPVTLLVNISAPEHSRLDYETESYYISRALHDHVGVVVNEMGELEDLLTGLQSEPPPLGVHFSGHGGPGILLFEDAYGDECPVRIDELLNNIRRVAPERFPRFFYLACCHGGDPPTLLSTAGQDAPQGGLPATATALHREGVAQVVAYFGPVYDRQSTAAEAAFYAEIANGRRTRDAVRAARLAMSRPFMPAVRDTARDLPTPGHMGLTPFAWAQLVFYHRGPDYPLGCPIPRRFAMTLEAPPQREEELVFLSGRSRILRKGFIGRRKKLHALRHDLRQGKHVHVVQGLGGLGKTALCYEALKLYKRLGWEALMLWCAEVESATDPVNALLRQFSDQAARHIGEAWQAILAAIDSHAAIQPALQRPAVRLIVLLRALLDQQGQLPLVLYLDNLESLLHGPNTDEATAIRTWRDAESAELWQGLAQFAQTSGGRFALLGSCRYRHTDFASALVPLDRLPADAVWRMLGWFPSLRRLSVASRMRLVEQLAGHPRAVEWLDGLISRAIIQWEDRHGPLPETPTTEQAQVEWHDIVAPALPSLTQQLSEDLLFGALWERMLDESARRLLVRATVLRRPSDWHLLRALTAETGENGADAAIRCLRDASLLTEVQERRASGSLERYLEVHPHVAQLACQHASATNELLRQGHRRAGDFLEERARHSVRWDDDVEAAYHLGEVGEADRAFDLLLSLTQWLQQRGRNLDTLAMLDMLKAPEALHLQNQGRFLVIRGQAYVGLGNLPRAIAEVRQAVEILQQLAQQDPSNTEWQRDLSVSHDNIGDMLAAQGDGAEALAAYQRSLAIRERLAQQDPSNTQWQRDLSVSHDKIGNMLAAQGDGAEALAAYQRSLAIRERLAQQDPSNTEWQRDLSISHNKIGDMLAAQGDGAEALAAYQRSLAIRERLAQQDPSNTEWQRDLSVSHDNIGNMLAAQGDGAEALAAYQRSLAIRERLAQQDPSNTQWQRDLSISHNNIGDMLAAQGDGAEALAAYQRSLAIRERLAQQDPSNTEWQRDLSISHNNIGDMLAAQGDGAEALAAYQRSLAIRERLAQQDPSNTEWQRDLSISHNNIGNMLAAQGDGAEALAAYQRSLAIRERLAQQDPSNTEWQRDLSISHDKIGNMLAAQGDGAEALAAYQRSLAIRERLAQQDPSNTQWQTDLVVSYWKLVQGSAPVAKGYASQNELLEKGLAILYRLRAASRLTKDQEGWIGTLEQALQAPHLAREEERPRTRGRSWWHRLWHRKA